MSLLESLGKVKIGVWQFWRIVANRNRDLPFHDFQIVDWNFLTPDDQV